MTDSALLPYGRQWIDEDDIAAVVHVLRGDYLTGGPAVVAFEKALLEAVGSRYAVSCANGTAALHLASLALDLGAHDWVIVPAVTFLATANAVRFVGADVWFADVDPQTGLMTRDTLEQAYQSATAAGKKVKAVYSVHLNGQAADPQGIYEFAREHGLFVVEDASHAIGTTFQRQGQQSTIGACETCDIATFSFHPVKTIAMGEGGAVTTTNPQLFSRIQSLRNHGMTRNPEEFTVKPQAFTKSGEANPWYYEMHQVGFNYRASDISCALGLSQLGKLEYFSKRRHELASLYDSELQGLSPLLRPIAKVPGCDPVLHLYVVLIDFQQLGVERAALMVSLAAEGVLTQVHYLPVNRQPYYTERYGQFNLPGANNYYEAALSLPFFPAMQDEQVGLVVGVLERLLYSSSCKASGT